MGGCGWERGSRDKPITELIGGPFLTHLGAPRRQVLCCPFTHMWAPERARVIPSLPKLLPPAPAPTLAPIRALTAPVLETWMLSLLLILVPHMLHAHPSSLCPWEAQVALHPPFFFVPRDVVGMTEDEYHHRWRALGAQV